MALCAPRRPQRRATAILRVGAIIATVRLTAADAALPAARASPAFPWAGPWALLPPPGWIPLLPFSPPLAAGATASALAAQSAQTLRRERFEAAAADGEELADLRLEATSDGGVPADGVCSAAEVPTWRPEKYPYCAPSLEADASKVDVYLPLPNEEFFKTVCFTVDTLCLAVVGAEAAWRTHFSDDSATREEDPTEAPTLPWEEDPTEAPTLPWRTSKIREGADAPRSVNLHNDVPFLTVVPGLTFVFASSRMENGRNGRSAVATHLKASDTLLNGKDVADARTGLMVISFDFQKELSAGIDDSTRRAYGKLVKKGSEGELVSIPIDDYHPPTSEQIGQMVEAVAEARSKNRLVIMHCNSGEGRTGFMSTILSSIAFGQHLYDAFMRLLWYDYGDARVRTGRHIYEMTMEQEKKGFAEVTRQGDLAENAALPMHNEAGPPDTYLFFQRVHAWAEWLLAYFPAKSEEHIQWKQFCDAVSEHLVSLYSKHLPDTLEGILDELEELKLSPGQKDDGDVTKFELITYIRALEKPGLGAEQTKKIKGFLKVMKTKKLKIELRANQRLRTVEQRLRTAGQSLRTAEDLAAVKADCIAKQTPPAGSDGAFLTWRGGGHEE